MTGWQYPNFEWARAHVPGVPSRCFVMERMGSELMILATKGSICPDPMRHVNQFLASRGLPVIPMAALQSSDEPDTASTEDDDPPT
jgi:hypothetical protein